MSNMSYSSTLSTAVNSPNIQPTKASDPPEKSFTRGDDDGHTTSGRTTNLGSGTTTTKEDFNAEHPLYSDLAPEDSYVDGVYWADLPYAQRSKWVNTQANNEALRELKHIGSMFKKDPLSPLRAYSSRYVIGGFGLFTEGYTLFSIGNLEALYESVWPQCWSTFQVCTSNWIAATSYLQILGIICGQIVVGIEGDWIGRRVGLVQDALVMTIGLVILTGSWGTDLQGWVICYAWAQFIYGFGVGGEYPMTSTTALESKSVAGGTQTDDKLHRGRNVGWGQLFNLVVLILLLLIFNHSGSPPYSESSAQAIFRVSFAIMAVMTLWLGYFRYFRTSYSSSALRKSKKGAKVNQSGYDIGALKLTATHFGGRLFGTTTTWFCNDFLFYGNKLFASAFIKIISPGSSNNVTTTWLWNLVNVGVSLAGYYLAALLIDHKFYGRKRMQIWGFLMDGILFLLPAIWFEQLQSSQHIHGFQVIYFLSSFFQQFGPNCTTFLLAAEVFPVSVRATAHGISAASGKVGALIPAVLYNYIGSRTRYWVVCWFGFAGWIITWIFIPDTTGLDLREQDRYWAFVRAGKAKDYHGIAVHPRHLSNWEIYVLKRHLAYDADLDRASRIEELRVLYEEKAQIKEQGRVADEEEDEEDSELSSAACIFFSRAKEYTEAPKVSIERTHVIVT